jgi:hypothetical protein
MTRQERSEEGTRILEFYSGRGRDDRGRTLAEILGSSDARLEEIHDYIQWLFPLPERSGANPEAPVLDGGTIAEFRADPALRATLHRAFLRMLEFYGLETSPDGVGRAASFEEKSRNWLRPGNHNHLRLTRILRSLTVLGLEQDALSLFRCLRSIYEADVSTRRSRITPQTFQFWSAAVEN